MLSHNRWKKNEPDEGVDFDIVEESDDEEIDLLPHRPAYFDEFDKFSADSEEEMVAGENNYIEI